MGDYNYGDEDCSEESCCKGSGQGCGEKSGSQKGRQESREEEVSFFIARKSGVGPNGPAPFSFPLLDQALHAEAETIQVAPVIVTPSGRTWALSASRTAAVTAAR